jgi:hypothetical protein
MKLEHKHQDTCEESLFYIIYRIYLFFIYRIGKKYIFFAICIENCE